MQEALREARRLLEPHILAHLALKKGLNKFKIQESYDQRLHLVAGWLTSLQRTRTSWAESTTVRDRYWVQVYRLMAFEIIAQWQVKCTGLENKAQKTAH